MNVVWKICVDQQWNHFKNVFLANRNLVNIWFSHNFLNKIPVLHESIISPFYLIVFINFWKEKYQVVATWLSNDGKFPRYSIPFRRLLNNFNNAAASNLSHIRFFLSFPRVLHELSSNSIMSCQLYIRQCSNFWQVLSIIRVFYFFNVSLCNLLKMWHQWSGRFSFCSFWIITRYKFLISVKRSIWTDFLKTNDPYTMKYVCVVKFVHSFQCIAFPSQSWILLQIF